MLMMYGVIKIGLKSRDCWWFNGLPLWCIEFNHDWGSSTLTYECVELTLKELNNALELQDSREGMKIWSRGNANHIISLDNGYDSWSCDSAYL